MKKFLFIIFLTVVGCAVQHKPNNKDCKFINDYKFLKCYHDRVNLAVHNNMISDEHYNKIICDCYADYFKD